FSKMHLFEKIRQGELWRFFSPILLHNDILHIFFNMIWLLVLSPQIEMRIGSRKLLWFIMIVAFFSNTAQYLVSGPYFIGFSGVICGMAFFMKGRQKVAAWEGYVLSRQTFAFICFFIGILALLSLVSFIVSVFFDAKFAIPIANTGHLVGALSGYLLA